MIKKYILLAVAGIFSCSAALCQEQLKHEFSVWGAGGLSTLKVNSKIGNNKNGAGTSFGIGYNYFVTEQWSVGSGLELSFYNARTTINSISDKYSSNDGEYDFEFRTTVSDYKENQNATYLNIPLLAQFQMPVLGKNQFYAAGGFKLGIPVSKKYKIAKASMKNSGYYPLWNDKEELVLDTQEFMGFGSFKRNNIKRDLDLKVACLLSLEAGMKWKVGETTALYTGAYFDYGLNDINKSTNKRLVEYNKVNPEDFINNSILSSRYTTTDGKSEKLTKKVLPMALGLKVRFAFGI